jgi:RHS repeat-associated protein
VYLQQAVRLRPASAEAHNNLGLAFADQGRWVEAEAAYQRSLELRPGYVEAMNNLASAYGEDGWRVEGGGWRDRTDEAQAVYEMALWHQSDCVSAHWNRALCWLQAGEFEKGWAEYEWRWRRKQTPERRLPGVRLTDAPRGETLAAALQDRSPAPRGETLTAALQDRSPAPRGENPAPRGKTILIHTEQGLGDTLQFVRYAAVLKARGARVILECPGFLIPLLKGTPGIDQFVAEGMGRPGYDAVGNTTNVIDQDSNKTTFAFDSLNRETQQIDPLGYASSTAYDAAGRKTSATDRNGSVISYSYDAINRETGETWKQSGSTVNVLTFTYNAMDELTAANYAGTYTMGYDKLNRMSSVQEPFGQILTYSFDSVGNRTTTQDSQGGTLTAVYNADNLVTSKQFDDTSSDQLRIDLTYTSRNQIGTETRYSDDAGTSLVGTTSYTFDSTDRISNIQHKNATPSVIANYTYTYDLASRLSTETDNGTNITYSYDAESELTDAGGTVYGYDLAGNRTMAGYSTGTGNELLNDGTWTYTYDHGGQMTEKSMGTSATTWYYSYNNAGQMISAIEDSQPTGGTLLAQATFVYDAMGNRVEQDEYTQSSGLTTVTRFAYDGPNVWADLNGSNQLQMRRFYLAGVDQVFARADSTGNTAWYLSDRLGSIRLVMNPADTTTDLNTYDAFGNITAESNQTFGDRYKWTGREYDSLIGMQYNRARYYSAQTGRWFTEDPLGFSAGDRNLYRYVSNNPLLETDASGELPPGTWPTWLGLSVAWSDFTAAYGAGTGRYVPKWVSGLQWYSFASAWAPSNNYFNNTFKNSPTEVFSVYDPLAATLPLGIFLLTFKLDLTITWTNPANYNSTLVSFSYPTAPGVAPLNTLPPFPKTTKGHWVYTLSVGLNIASAMSSYVFLVYQTTIFASNKGAVYPGTEIDVEYTLGAVSAVAIAGPPNPNNGETITVSK